MLKPTQEEQSWSYVLHFIIFSHFSFSAISQACFHVRWKLASLHNDYISQALIYIQKKCHGLVFKQLWTHSFIFNSHGIIHSIVELASCWSMLTCPDFTVNWSLILFSNVELSLASKTKIKHKSRELTVKYSWIYMLLVLLQSRLKHNMQEAFC